MGSALGAGGIKGSQAGHAAARSRRPSGVQPSSCTPAHQLSAPADQPCGLHRSDGQRVRAFWLAGLGCSCCSWWGISCCLVFSAGSLRSCAMLSHAPHSLCHAHPIPSHARDHDARRTHARTHPCMLPSAPPSLALALVAPFSNATPARMSLACHGATLFTRMRTIPTLPFFVVPSPAACEERGGGGRRRRRRRPQGQPQPTAPTRVSHFPIQPPKRLVVDAAIRPCHVML